MPSPNPTPPLHSGHPFPPGRWLFAPPPAAIGEVVSAHSSVPVGARPPGPALKVAAAIGGAVLGGVLFCVLAWLYSTAFEVSESTFSNALAGAAACGAAVGGVLGLRAGRKGGECTYVGRQGAARIPFPIAAGAATVFRFSDAKTLTTRLTRHMRDRTYQFTDWKYEWKDERGATVFALRGVHEADAGPLPPDNALDFAESIERMWNRHLLEAAGRELSEHGYISFDLNKFFGGLFVRVGHGFLEFHSRTRTERWPVHEIERISLGGGTFSVERASRFRTSRLAPSRYTFEYGKMANASFFRHVLERLGGFRWT